MYSQTITVSDGEHEILKNVDGTDIDELCNIDRVNKRASLNPAFAILYDVIDWSNSGEWSIIIENFQIIEFQNY